MHHDTEATGLPYLPLVTERSGGNLRAKTVLSVRMNGNDITGVAESGCCHQESGTFRNTSFDLEPGTPPCMVILCIKMGSIHMPWILSNLLLC